MTYFERVDELRDNTNFTAEGYQCEFDTAEIVLVDLFGEYIKGAEINSTIYGTGKVVGTSGYTLDQMLMEVAFAEETKKLLVLPVITGKVLCNKFADISEVGDAWDHAFDLHTDLFRKYVDMEKAERAAKKEAAKKEARIKSAEASFDKRMAKALKDFEEFSSREVTISKEDDFYFALGWLANHMGVLTAKLPDYLGSAFEKHFGAETPKILIDGRAKTSGGYAKQWSWEFKCTINKLKNTTVPVCIQHVTTDFSKGIHNTAFLWDLVSNYGFQFGKKRQDAGLIADCIPAKHLASFEAGLIA